MKLLSIRLFSVLFLICINYLANSQEELSANDTHKIALIQNTLSLDSVQKNDLESVFTSYSSRINKIKKEISSIEKSDMPEDDVVLQVSVLSSQKRELLKLRDLDVQNILTAEQLKQYFEEIEIAKPEVLHFGIHDRLNCKVCLR